MGTTKMGYEGPIYIGAAGSTATTQITNRTDITENVDPERGDTTTAGDGTSVPIGTSRVTCLNYSIEWTMLKKTVDASLTTLVAAATAGTAIALRTKDYASGLGFDGDVTLGMKKGKPLKGEQTIAFTAEPTDDEGRTPQFNV